MKKSSQVTLCIPVFNAEKTIASTLESLINQDYPIFKIKIFNNASTDRSQEICQSYAEKFSYIELYTNSENIGAEANFTKCILGAEGDYCAVVHSDDIYEKNFVSKSVEVLENNSDCVASFCGALEIDMDEKVIGTRFLPKELDKEVVTPLSKMELLKLIMKYANFITCPSVFVRSVAYREKIQNWNGEKYKTSADLDIWLRLAELGKLASIKNPLMKYRVADASYSYRIAKKRTTRHDIFLVLDQYRSLADKSDYYFLQLKDQSIRCLNIIRNKKRDECFPLDLKFNIISVLEKMLHSRWHFKMGLAIMGIHAFVKALIIIGWNRSCQK